MVSLLGWGVLAAQIAGCASLEQQMDRKAAAQGYRRQVIPGEGFQHVVYSRNGDRPSEEGAEPALHVYLEFPLNHISIMGTFGELRGRLSGTVMAR